MMSEPGHLNKSMQIPTWIEIMDKYVEHLIQADQKYIVALSKLRPHVIKHINVVSSHKGRDMDRYLNLKDQLMILREVQSNQPEQNTMNSKDWVMPL